jgi:cytochrome c6
LKRILSAVLAIIPAIAILFSAPAFAADAGAGATVFSANCAACHAGGGNVINPAKTLTQKDLEANGKNSADAIATQVTNGNGAMPAFGGRLSADDIQNVAAYVLEKSAAGW